MFIGKQAIKRVGWLKKSIILLCIFTLFILPIANILSAHPALASKDPSRFSNLKENDQYKFFTYASAMAQCFKNTQLSVHTDVDDQMLKNNVVFSTWDGMLGEDIYVYVGTYPEVKGFNKGGIKCNGTEFQQEAFNTFGISPNELLCYMGYPKNGLKGKNDSNTKHEECVALGLTNDFTYNKMPENGGENFLNALTALTGYDRSVAEKNAYIKYRKYSDWIKGCVDGEATSKSDNTWKVSVVNTDTKKVDRIYKPKGKTEHMYDGGTGIYNKPELSCESIESELAIAAKKYLNVLKAQAVSTACAGLADEKLKACKDGASHESDTEYCGTKYAGDEASINACKQGQSAKIEAPEEEEGGEPKNSCGIDGGLGWLICPVMTFVANINDAAYGAISGFLDIKPAILGDNSNTSGAKQGWDFFRNIANAIFAVIFLWIIFSQISNVGVSNYGIKKILPRLIIGALLVNLSYYLCQIFVDLSNILGHTLKDALEAGAGGIGTESEAAGWGSAIAATIVGVGGVAAFAALAIGIPTLAAGFLAIMTVFIILVVRQAGIILLISMSPIAFAAWLLPNTEDLFKKWMKMFRGLLLVFPIISLLYGAGKLAGAVLASSATVDPNNPDETLHLVALAATTMPLIATPFVLQNSLSSLGSIGAKIGKLSSAANGNLKNAVMNKSRISDVKNAWKSRSARKLAERRSGNTWYGRTASNLRDRNNSMLKRGLGVAMNPAAALDDSWVGRKIGLSSGAGAAQEAYDKAAMEKAERAITYQYGGDAEKALKDKKADKYTRIAAVNQLKGQGSHGADVVANYLRDGGEVDSVSMANALTEMKGSHAGVSEAGVKALKDLQSGQSSFSLGQKDSSGNVIGDSAKDEFNSLTKDGVRKLSNEAIAKQNADAIKHSAIKRNDALKLLKDDRLRSMMSQDTKNALVNK